MVVGTCVGGSAWPERWAEVGEGWVQTYCDLKSRSSASPRRRSQ